MLQLEKRANLKSMEYAYGFSSKGLFYAFADIIESKNILEELFGPVTEDELKGEYLAKSAIKSINAGEVPISTYIGLPLSNYGPDLNSMEVN